MSESKTSESRLLSKKPDEACHVTQEDLRSEAYRLTDDCPACLLVGTRCLVAFHSTAPVTATAAARDTVYIEVQGKDRNSVGKKGWRYLIYENAAKNVGRYQERREETIFCEDDTLVFRIPFETADRAYTFIYDVSLAAVRFSLVQALELAKEVVPVNIVDTHLSRIYIFDYEHGIRKIILIEYEENNGH